MQDSALDIILQWSDEQTAALCKKLTRVTSCPRNLKRILDKGVRCTDMVDLMYKDVSVEHLGPTTQHA